MDHSDLFERSTKNQDGITGVRVGIVTDNDDPNDLGRVRLRFPWRQADDESYWARIATLMAGDEYGSYCVPEIDEEVLVAFAGGDIHRPFVIGSLWNGEKHPPQETDEDNDIREIVSRDGHRLQFDDDETDGGLQIETNEGHRIKLDDTDGSEQIEIVDTTGNNRIQLDSDAKTVSIEAGDTLELNGETIKLRGNNVDINGKQSLDLTGGSSVDVSSNGKLDIASQGPMDIDSGAILNMNGKWIFLN